MSDSALERRSRRALLTGGFAGLTALVANAILRPLPASAAAGGPLILGQSNDAGSAGTFLASHGTTQTFTAQNLSLGFGLYAVSAANIGVVGVGTTGVQGTAFGNGGISVHGVKYADTGPAVKGENLHASNGYAAVYGVTNGTGPAVYGEGLAAGNGTSGVAKGTGSGVYGQSDNGRGGRFKGKKAQIRLEPSTTVTHPSSGDAGDIFLDKSKRLWLCKGGTTWVRIV